MLLFTFPGFRYYGGVEEFLVLAVGYLRLDLIRYMPNHASAGRWATG